MPRGSFAIGFVFGLVGSMFLVAPSFGETCIDCQKNVQTEMARCVSVLPRKVRPADPRKPTDAERKTQSERADKSTECSRNAQVGFNACRKTAGCP